MMFWRRQADGLETILRQQRDEAWMRERNLLREVGKLQNKIDRIAFLLGRIRADADNALSVDDHAAAAFAVILEAKA